MSPNCTVGALQRLDRAYFEIIKNNIACISFMCKLYFIYLESFTNQRIMYYCHVNVAI